MKKLVVKVLGSGTSQGVPMIACNCVVCTSDNPKDKRLRSSILFTYDDENFVIDTGPDFRYQMLRENVISLSGVLFTHEHKDHIAGLDDVRAFNFKEGRDMEIFCTLEVETALRREFHYAFNDNPYPGVPSFHLNRIESDNFWVSDKLSITPILYQHYKMPVTGFRIGDFTYITDCKTIESAEREKVRGSKVLIVNCLRKEEHIAHFNLTEVLEFIADVQPKITYLTHISHLLGSHEEVSKLLPENVYLAYDGLSIEL